MRRTTRPPLTPRLAGLAVAAALVGSLRLPAANAQTPATPAAAVPGQVTVPPRDHTPLKAEPSAVVRGRVVDVATGQPLRRVVISAGSAGQRGEPKTTATDDRGRYELRRLPAGDLFLSANKPGYVPQHLGQRRPRDTRRPVTLRDGQVLEQADFALERGGVITGRVVDEAGEPVLNVMVSAYRQARSRGKRTLEPAGGGSTNDLGVYRIFGLAPGAYFVKGISRLRLNTSEDEAREYSPTYYPGTASESSAQPVAVAASQESVADFPLGLTRSATVSGIVLGSDGRPVTSGRVQAIEISAGGRGISFFSEHTSGIASDGAFAIRGLVAGSWVLTASASLSDDPFLSNVGGREHAVLPVELAGEDQAVTLTMAAGGTVRGRIRFEGEPPAAGLAELQVSLRQVEGGMAVGGGTVKLQPDGTFQSTGVVGRRVVEVGRLPLDPEWVEDPEQVERLQVMGEAVTVTDGETTTVALRLVVM